MGSGARKAGQLQQPHRGRVLVAKPLQRHRPGGVDPPGIADHVAAGEQGRPVGAEPAQIVGGRQIRLFQVAGGLCGGQRQIPEFGGELVGQLLAQGRDAGS